MIQYNTSEAIETVYTYEEWLKEYNRRETKRRIRQRTERLYYMKQHIYGFIMVIMGIVTPIVLMDITFSLFVLPLGIYLLLTKERIIRF